MATATVDSLGGRGDCTFAVPPGADGDSPLVVLLHGVYGSHWSWALLGRAATTLGEMAVAGEVRPMILAMPSDGLSGFTSGYVDAGDRRVREWVAGDVPELAGRLTPYRGAARFIGGLSMGGWGAIKIGAAGFAGIAAHSAVTSEADLATFAVGPEGMAPEAGAGADLAGPGTGAMPPLYLDCGNQDPLLESNRRLHQALLEQGIAHVYEEAEGGHDWDYWSRRLPFSLRFFDRLFQEMP
jgi:S-formylglutathione hydrolase FrmB